MNHSVQSIFIQNSNPIIKDNNSASFKKIISAMYSSVFSYTILENELNSILHEYKRLRDKLKNQMYQTQDVYKINQKNLDIHKICACLTFAIYRKLETIPKNRIPNNENIDYIKTTFAYSVSLFFIKMYIEKTTNIIVDNDIPIFHFNQKISYDEFLFAYIYNNESNIVIENHIGCIHSLSHIYYLIQELWYCQSNK